MAESPLKRAKEATKIIKNVSGYLLLGELREKENLTQIESAKMIRVAQGNLSSMESGRRGIGRMAAKRIQKRFGIDYRMFL
jgi:transcriptional regulator with XRE-family HTH domain